LPGDISGKGKAVTYVRMAHSVFLSESINRQYFSLAERIYNGFTVMKLTVITMDYDFYAAHI